MNYLLRCPILMTITFLFLCCLNHNTVTATVFPSIVWSPYNPIFSCSEPTLNVNINDEVRFLCPFNDVGFRQPPEGLEKPIYENMYFLGENQTAYKQCNASGPRSTLSLLCDKVPATFGNLRKIIFQDTQASPGSFVFKEGADYYYIGTGFRSQDNVNNKIGGSCDNVEQQVVDSGFPQYKLRLKIHVCKQGELCPVCKTTDCYSKGATCQQKATTSTTTTSTNTTTTTAKTTSNPPATPNPAPQAAPPETDKDNSFVYIAIPFFFVCLVLGVLIGMFGFQKYHKRSCPNQVGSQTFSQAGEKGKVNLSYQPSVTA